MAKGVAREGVLVTAYVWDTCGLHAEPLQTGHDGPESMPRRMVWLLSIEILLGTSLPSPSLSPWPDPSLKIVNSSMVYTSPEACKPIRTSDDGMEVRLGALARVQGDVKVTVSNSWGKVRA